MVSVPLAVAALYGVSQLNNFLKENDLFDQYYRDPEEAE
jgi:hypothetical protein